MSEESMFSPQVRRAAVVWVAVAGVIVIVASFFIRGEREFWIGWILGAGPFTTPTLFLSYAAARRAPEVYRAFWWRFFLGLATAYSAGVLAVFGRFFGARILIVAAAAIGLASFPLFFLAGVVTLRVRAAGRALSVDLLDVAISVIALAAPGVYFLLVPALESGDPLALTLAVVGVAMLGPLYIAILNFFRLPPGERSGEVLFSTLTALTTINVTLIVVQTLRDFTLPAPPLFLVHVANMGLLVLTPLYARSLEVELPIERMPPASRPRRIHALPFIALMLIPPLAIYAQRHSSDRPWGPAYVMAVLVVLIAIGAARQYLSNRETRRLNSELERVAEQRRELLARMVRALEAERHRFGTELHGTAIESFAAIGTLLQTAYAQLPPGTAAVVREALGSVRHDMNDRIERLRQLMVAIQPPELEEAGLSAALTAYASELFSGGEPVEISVSVDPELALDWSSQSIVYRLSQEGLLNVRKHSRAKSVAVTVTESHSSLLLEISDDGRGFDPATSERGAGLESMASLAALGRGRLSIDSRPGAGCVIRIELGVEQHSIQDARDTGESAHLHLVIGGDETTNAQGTTLPDSRPDSDGAGADDAHP